MAAEAEAEGYYNGAVNKHGTPHGIGERKYTNGNVYVGKFVNGKRCGTGTMKFATRDVYEGEWEDGLMHGKGKWSSGLG
jgi:hypothetical protein